MSKKIIVSLSVFFVSLVFLISGALYAHAQGAPGIPPPVPPSNEPFEVCMGKALAKYMNTAIENSKGLSNIRFVSPAFNLTNPQEFQIFTNMRAAGANFAALNAFAGNTYSNVGDTRSAYAWFVSNGWKGAFGGKPMIFTEFGDFKTTGASTPQSKINEMKRDYSEAAADGSVISINYFNILGNNPDPNFAFHVLGPDRFREITNGNGKAGINSATWVSGGGFQQQAGAAGAAWTVEILGGVGDIDQAVASVNAAQNIVLRLCASGDTCAFSDPTTLALFLNVLNSRINKPVYVIIGPNEPATEKWAGPQCKPTTKPFVLEEVPCNETRTPEFHSLRPYPTSPCNRSVETSYYQCGNDLVVKEQFVFTPGGGACTTIPGPGGVGGTLRCKYTVSSNSNVSLGLSKADFPIMGNTELVTNGENKGSPPSKLSFLQRANEYVSWYLNGIPFRAEEAATNANTKVPGKINIGINVDLGGPLKKLLPSFIQTLERKDEQQAIGNTRHDQIVECGGNNPQACYSDSTDYKRITDVFGNVASPAFPYIPFSSTEDRVGQARTNQTGFGTCGNGFTNNTDSLGIQCADFKVDNLNYSNLYFAHIEEDNKLGQLLQNTFKPNNIEEKVDDTKLAELNKTPFCELLESRRNPGDRLYGELARTPDDQPLAGKLNYTANFSCDFQIPGGPATDLCIANCKTDAACAARCTEVSSTCQREVFIPFSVQSFTPGLETTWERFVNGNMSIVKRIFPQVGVGTPIEELKDIPGETRASYLSQNQGVSGGGSLLSSEALAGNPAQNRSGSTAKLFFPHIGSVYDYFLKGIQKALRPKGIEDVNNGLPNTAQCTIQGSGIQSNALLKIISDAAQWAHVPVEVLITTVRVEGRCRDNTGTGTVCGLTDAEVATYSQPGVEWPVNCPGGGAVADGRAKGPLQFYHNTSSGWGIWSNAVNLGGDNRTPNICNIKDSIYAAAWALSSSYGTANHCPQPNYNVALTNMASAWTKEEKERALLSWSTAATCNGNPTISCSTLAGSNLTAGLKAIGETYCNYFNTYSSQIVTDCNNQTGGASGPISSSNSSCFYGDAAIANAIRNTSSKYGIPAEMLNAIFHIEGFDYLQNPSGYICKENPWRAAGIMQVTAGTYNTVTCPNERQANDTASCAAEAGKLSRCNVDTEMELAARVLLLKIGGWKYGICDGAQRDTANISSSDINSIYHASSYYYGTCYPDRLTKNYAIGAKNRGDISVCRDNDCNNMGYGDIVCAFMAKTNGQNYCNNPNNFPSRAGCVN